MKAYPTVILLLSLFFVAVDSVRACECPLQQNVEKAIDQAAAVFSGKVVDFEYRNDIRQPPIDQAAKDLTGDSAYEILTVRIEVERW